MKMQSVGKCVVPIPSLDTATMHLHTQGSGSITEEDAGYKGQRDNAPAAG